MSDINEVFFEDDDFTSSLKSSPQAIPQSINIAEKRNGSVVLSIDLDAVDGMSFLDASPILELPKKKQKQVVDLLGKTLKEKYGGKNMLCVPDDLVEVFTANGFDTHIKTPGGDPYSRLMVASKATLQEKMQRISAAYAGSDADSNLAVISDKRQLLEMSQELSDLMIENADYASADSKRPLYTAAAMAERIDQKNVRSVAVVNPGSGKPIAFLRAYLKEGVGVYMSDFVVAEEHRKNGLGPKIMQAALDSVKDDQEIQNVFLIAGSGHKENSYNKLLGFKSVTEQAQVTKLEGGTFMSSLFPAKEILQELPNKLNQPRESVVERY